MTGAAPVPVPPPRPVVMNTMSEPSSAWRICSESSTAALFPTSGLAPAPRPFVSFIPSWSFIGARFERSAWQSVFAARNSIPATPEAIMRLTAFPPPPPIPMTRILAAGGTASSKLTLKGSFCRPGLLSIVIIRDLLVMVRTSPRTSCARNCRS